MRVTFPAGTVCRQRERGGFSLRICMALCIVLTALAPIRTRGDDAPKFRDPEVMAYVHALADFRDRYVSAARASRQGDDREIKQLDAALPAFQEKAVHLFDKLQPSETRRFTEYVNRCGQTMVDAALGFH